MHRSAERILTTHVGSLPRPPVLADLLLRRENGEPIDEALLVQNIDTAVREVVQHQQEAGIDIGNNGEQPRVAFHNYVTRRMRGFGGQGQRAISRDLTEFPDFLELWQAPRRAIPRPQAVAEVEYIDLREAEAECDGFLRYATGVPPPFTEGFMSAASPGIIATALSNAYYESHERYVFAVARQMQQEYELIHTKGLLLQLDCPDLAMERARVFQNDSLQHFQAIVEMHIAALNLSVANIPPERIRLHVCWGNYEGPHTHDVPLEAILPLLYQAKVGALSLELANPRHEHEYQLFTRYPLPETMLLIPGVIDSTTNFVEHPEAVAQRIAKAVEAVGDRSRVIASVDCGFGTIAGWNFVAPSVVWAKLRTLVEGARIASTRLWS